MNEDDEELSHTDWLDGGWCVVRNVWLIPDPMNAPSVQVRTDELQFMGSTVQRFLPGISLDIYRPIVGACLQQRQEGLRLGAENKAREIRKALGVE